ncbi:MAG: class A beta-lactamase [Candidatus Binataceae bacterium]
MSEDPSHVIVREIERVCAIAKAEIGLCATHIETGRRIAINEEVRFPMASTYKVPIAIGLLNLIERGALGLNDLVEITERDLSPGSGVIQELFLVPGIRLSVRNLLDLALRASDNIASDIFLRLAGGPAEVTAFIRQQGVADLRVDRSTKRILCDYYGIADAPSDEDWSLDQYRKLARATTDDSRAAAAEKYLVDPRDSCTPSAMSTLLVLLFRGQVLGKEQTDLLLSIMRNCRTGPLRLKGMLPAGTEVAHKTGTIPRVVNDVGIITLPDDAGSIAIAAFAKGKGHAPEPYEKAIADATRYVFDYFMFVVGE